MHAIATVDDVIAYYEPRKWARKDGTHLRQLNAGVNAVDLLIRKRRGLEKNKDKLEKRHVKVDSFTKTISDVYARRVLDKKKFVAYDKQLKDPRWIAFRDFVLTVRGHKCEICKSSQNLQVHHIVYRKQTKAWEYNVNEMMVLCRDCHANIHDKPR